MYNLKERKVTRKHLGLDLLRTFPRGTFFLTKQGKLKDTRGIHPLPSELYAYLILFVSHEDGISLP